MTTSSIATVLAWHDALNAADLETLLALSSDDIDIGDAHGAAQGHEALRRWAASRNATAEIGRIYVRDGVVVVEQKLSTPDNPGAVTNSASAFRVVRDHVHSFFQHHDLASAVAGDALP